MRGEVLSGVERRRRWSAQQKLQVACASWEPGARVAEVARRFEVTRQQVYDWRSAARRGEFAGFGAAAGFVEVIGASAGETIQPAAATKPSPTEGVTVEIAVAGGRSVRLPASLPTPDLMRLIRAVEGV